MTKYETYTIVQYIDIDGKRHVVLARRVYLIPCDIDVLEDTSTQSEER